LGESRRFDAVGETDALVAGRENAGDAVGGIAGDVVVFARGNPGKVGTMGEEDAIEMMAIEEFGKPMHFVRYFVHGSNNTLSSALKHPILESA
jgi:hypothetical protein